VNEVMQWRRWEAHRIGQTMMGANMSGSERRRQEVGWIRAAATRGRPNQSGSDERWAGLEQWQ
jgi:hypothetical protein